MPYTINAQITPGIEGLAEYTRLVHFAEIWVDTCLENGATLDQISDAVRVAILERDPRFVGGLSSGTVNMIGCIP